MDSIFLQMLDLIDDDLLALLDLSDQVGHSYDSGIINIYCCCCPPMWSFS